VMVEGEHEGLDRDAIVNKTSQWGEHQPCGGNAPN
jgi:hypothetical protein